MNDSNARPLRNACDAALTSHETQTTIIKDNTMTYRSQKEINAVNCAMRDYKYEKGLKIWVMEH